MSDETLYLRVKVPTVTGFEIVLCGFAFVVSAFSVVYAELLLLEACALLALLSEGGTYDPGIPDDPDAA